MDETNLVKRLREERVLGYMKRGRPKKSWDEVVKENIREACELMMLKAETSGDDAAEEWSTPVNWEDPAIKAERRRLERKFFPG